MTLPVVAASTSHPTLTLLGRSVDEYLHRLLAEEDVSAAGGSTPLAEAAGSEGKELYEKGAAEAADFAGKFNLYLIRKVGMFPDVSEQLSLGHLGRGDTTSAMVASEWYMRNNHFPGWGRPYEFAAELFNKVGKREEERRDMARCALRDPWWSLKDIKQVMEWSELTGSASEVRYALSAEAAAKATAMVTQFGYKEPRTPQEVALEEAGRLLDIVAAGGDESAGVGSSYSGITEQLAAAYSDAGLKDVANFIRSA